jgi:hypothetical protein
VDRLRSDSTRAKTSAIKSFGPNLFPGSEEFDKSRRRSTDRLDLWDRSCATLLRLCYKTVTEPLRLGSGRPSIPGNIPAHVTAGPEWCRQSHSSLSMAGEGSEGTGSMLA